MFPGVQKSVKEWTLTLPNELPLWKLESWWTPEFSKSNCRGQNPSDGRVLFIIGKLLELRCLKWARITHLDTSHTNYNQKKGHESNWQFDSQPLKVRNHPNFLACRWHVTYHWKALNKGYNFALDFISIGGLYANLWAPKITGILIMRISGLPLGSPGTKWHLGASPVAKHKVYYKGEGGGFLQVRALMNFVSSCLPMVRLCTKVPPLRTNQLVVSFVQVCMNKWSACQFS